MDILNIIDNTIGRFSYLGVNIAMIALPIYAAFKAIQYFKSPRGGGPLGAVLFLLPEPGPKTGNQPGQRSAQAVGTACHAVEGERQGENE